MPSVDNRRTYAAANARAVSPAWSPTRVSRRSRNSVEPASVSSARLTRVNLAQAGLERLELLPDRRGQGRTEAVEMGLGLVELRARLVEIDAQRLGHAGVVETVELEVLGARHEA